MKTLSELMRIEGGDLIQSTVDDTSCVDVETGNDWVMSRETRVNCTSD